MRPESEAATAASCFARRFPVLLFFGIRKSVGRTSVGVRTAELVDGLMSPVPH